MQSLHDWLYDHYALPKLNRHHFPDYVNQDKEELNTLLSHLPQEEQLNARDLIDRLKCDQTQLAFTYGIRFGIMLLTPIDLENN